MKFFSRFFATRPDFSKPDSVIEHEPEPGTPEFEELMCMQPAQREALLALIRLACAHLPPHEIDAVYQALTEAMCEGGDADEVLVSFLDEGPLANVKPKFFFSAEPRRLPEARDSFEQLRAALTLGEPLPGEVTDPPEANVAASIAAFGTYLLRHDVHPLHLTTAADTYYMLCVASSSAAKATSLAKASGLGVRTNESFREHEVDA